MLRQVCHLREGLSTQAPGIGPLGCVRASVAQQCQAEVKDLGALLAEKWVLAYMYMLVLQQGHMAAEGLGTLAAGGLLACVHLLVMHQVCKEHEGLAAVWIHVRPLASVHVPVCHQVGALAESLAALGASVWPLACVYMLVQCQVHVLAEGMPAL